MATENKQMTSSQLRYERDVEELVRIPRRKLNPGSRVFLRKYFSPTDEPKHNLAPISTEPYVVTEVYDNMCIILRDNNVAEIVTLDRVFLASLGTADSVQDENADSPRMQNLEHLMHK